MQKLGKLFVEEIFQFEPMDWLQLSQAAASMRVTYGQMAFQAATEIAKALDNARFNTLHVNDVARHNAAYKSSVYLHAQASAVHLGAQAAHIENKKGAFFNVNDGHRRLDDALDMGHPISCFAIAAHETVKRSLGLRPRARGMEPHSLREIDALFDQAAAGSRKIHVMKPHLCLKGETILGLVEIETGLEPSLKLKHRILKVLVQPSA